MRTTALGFIALLSLAVGCVPTPVSSTGPQTVRTAEEAHIQGPFVPAGTAFSIRLDQSLDTLGSGSGQRFTGVVSRSLADRSGNVIVPAGAHVNGHVQSVIGTTGVPRLRLHFEGIETVAGVKPIAVRVSSADLVTYAGPPQVTAAPFGYDSWYGSYYGSYPAPIGGGPVAWPSYGYGYGYGGYDVYIPREVHLPAGATIDLVLTRPVLGPNARTIK